MCWKDIDILTPYEKCTPDFNPFFYQVLLHMSITPFFFQEMLTFTVCAWISNGKFNSRFAEYFFQPYSVLVPFFRMDFTVQTRNISPAFSGYALMFCGTHSEHSIGSIFYYYLQMRKRANTYC